MYQGTNSPGPHFLSRPYGELNSLMCYMPTAHLSVYANDPCGCSGSQSLGVLMNLGHYYDPSSLSQDGCTTLPLPSVQTLWSIAIIEAGAKPRRGAFMSSHIWNCTWLEHLCEPTIREKTLHSAMGAEDLHLLTSVF